MSSESRPRPSASGDDEYALVADLYDYVPMYTDRGDVAFYVDAAKASGGPVLEVGCGTGRILIPIARAGVGIVGVDLSPHMLEICRERLASEDAQVRANVRLVEADMRGFDLQQSFTLITIPFRPFQHLTTVREQVDCLRTCHRHLADEGRLILDLFNPWLEALVNTQQGVEFGDEPEVTLPDGRRFRRRHTIAGHDRAAQTTQVELVYYVTNADGHEERIVHRFAMRYLFRFEVEHLLTSCGFEVDHLYAGYNREPFGSVYPGELVFIARKRS